MIVGSSAVSCTVFARACAGERSLTSMDRAPRCSTGSIAGANAACGSSSLLPLRDVWTRHCLPWWTAQRFARTARPPAQKGDAETGDRPLARRPYHQNPCVVRPARPALRLDADGRPGSRYLGCSWPAGTRCNPHALSRRQGLRRRRHQRLSHQGRQRSGHTIQGQPQRTQAARPHRLQDAQHHRALLQPAQGLAWYRNSLRQKSRQLPGRPLSRLRSHLLDAMRPRPSPWM